MAHAPTSSLLRALSIQSFVIHGYVGNKCAMFALQNMGIEVDPICTVQFSNHTGYSKWRGEVTPGEQIWDMFEGLCENGLDHYDYLLTGYCREGALHRVIDIYEHLKQQNPNLIYVCDPVMGDNDALYVPPEVAELYRTQIIKRADVILPNQTECEYLTGTKFTDMKSVVTAMDQLHALGIRTVVITSMQLADDDPDFFYVVGSAPAEKQRFKMRLKKIPGAFSGTGDLLAALLLAWLSRGLSTKEACFRTVCAIQTVLKCTHRKGRCDQWTELELLQCREDVVAPKLSEAAFTVEDIDM
eukprot:TRINITY_DN13506_c0_g1_i1.p1 TRINITY_DN13506_c0_g1~~TRINITY_DN13506_c0_g1_i1.p1  ORF type:complete len:307 (-),score=78.45 TRINITY_DN13506_c0_g1_i1:65-964(-)